MKTRVLDVTENQDLRGELTEVERRIKELRGARHAITYDLEQSLKERDRLRRHLNASHEDVRGGTMLDPIATERAERDLDRFIDSQAKKRRGQDEANLLAMEWAASERRVQAQRREENKALWIEHYRRLTVVHLELAKGFRRRAREMQANEIKETA